MPAITDDPYLLTRCEQLDVLIDLTGAVELGAHLTLDAIKHHKHMILMNAEVDATVGPILKSYADAEGVIVSAADGDQPGVQINLARFVRGLGCIPRVLGNIKGLQDEYRTPTTQQGFAEQWGQNVHMVTSFADGSKVSFEQAIVANAVGLTVHKRGMLGQDHDGHVDELTTKYDIDELRRLGGVVDYVVKAKPGPGVFCLAEHPDPKQQHYLKLFKLGRRAAVQLLHAVPPVPSRAAVHHRSRRRLRRLGRLARRSADGRGVRRRQAGPEGGQKLDDYGGYDTYGQAVAREGTPRRRLPPRGHRRGLRPQA